MRTFNRISATTRRSGDTCRPRTSCVRSRTSNSSGTRPPAATTAQDLYGDGYPGSDPDTVARHLFTDGGVDYAILNPLTRGNIADYLLNSRICAAVNDWLLDRWLEPDSTGRFLGTIRVNPEDVKGAVAEIERLAGHPKMVQVGIPLQSREPYGKPMFEPIWEAAAAPRPAGRGPHQRRQRRRSRADLRRSRLHLSRICGVHAAELVRASGHADHRGNLRADTRVCGSCSPTAATTSSRR